MRKPLDKLRGFLLYEGIAIEGNKAMATLRKRNSRDTTAPLIEGPLDTSQTFISRSKEAAVFIRIGAMWNDKAHVVRMTQEEAKELVRFLERSIAKNEEDAKEYEARYGARDYWRDEGNAQRNILRDLEEPADFTGKDFDD